jgi:hypothetical protein
MCRSWSWRSSPDLQRDRLKKRCSRSLQNRPARQPVGLLRARRNGGQLPGGRASRRHPTSAKSVSSDDTELPKAPRPRDSVNREARQSGQQPARSARAARVYPTPQP